MALAAIIGGIQIASALLGNNQARKTSSINRSANRLREKRARISNAMARRKAMAAIRLKEANRAALAVATGQQGSSADSGTAASLASQSASTIANQRQFQNIDEQLSFANQKAADSQSTQNNIEGFGQLVSSFSAFDTGGSAATASIPTQAKITNSDIDFTQ